MAEPITFIDYQFGFASGEVQTISTQQGRDTIDETDLIITIKAHPDARTIETLVVAKDKLSYQRTETRIVEQEP